MIEIEVTSPVVSKLPIYARMRVPEIWLSNGPSLRILRLASGEYNRSKKSGVLPPLTEVVLSEFFEQSKTTTALAGEGRSVSGPGSRIRKVRSKRQPSKG